MFLISTKIDSQPRVLGEYNGDSNCCKATSLYSSVERNYTNASVTKDL